MLKLHTCLNIAIDIEPSANFSRGDSTLPAAPQVALGVPRKIKNINRFLFIFSALAEGEIAVVKRLSRIQNMDQHQAPSPTMVSIIKPGARCRRRDET